MSSGKLKLSCRDGELCKVDFCSLLDNKQVHSLPSLRVACYSLRLYLLWIDVSMGKTGAGRTAVKGKRGWDMRIHQINGDPASKAKTLAKVCSLHSVSQ